MAFTATWCISGDMAFSSRRGRDWFLMSHYMYQPFQSAKEYQGTFQQKLMLSFFLCLLSPLFFYLHCRKEFQLSRSKGMLMFLDQYSVTSDVIFYSQLIPLKGISWSGGHGSRRCYDCDSLQYCNPSTLLLISLVFFFFFFKRKEKIKRKKKSGNGKYLTMNISACRPMDDLLICSLTHLITTLPVIEGLQSRSSCSNLPTLQTMVNNYFTRGE